MRAAASSCCLHCFLPARLLLACMLGNSGQPFSGIPQHHDQLGVCTWHPASSFNAVCVRKSNSPGQHRALSGQVKVIGRWAPHPPWASLPCTPALSSVLYPGLSSVCSLPALQHVFTRALRLGRAAARPAPGRPVAARPPRQAGRQHRAGMLLHRLG